MQVLKGYSDSELQKVQDTFIKHLNTEPGVDFLQIGSTRYVWAVLNSADELKMKPSEVIGRTLEYQQKKRDEICARRERENKA